MLRSRTCTVVVFVVLLASGCSGSAGKPASTATAGTVPTTTGEPTRPSAYDQVLAQIAADGDVTLPTALQAFSLAFGELPGVTVPDGPREPVVFGGGPLRWVQRYWDDLTAEQRAAAVQHLGFDPTAEFGEDPTTSTSAASGVLAPRSGAAGAETCNVDGWGDPPGVQQYRDLFDLALKHLGAAVGPLPGLKTVRFCGSVLPDDDPDAWAAAHMHWGEKGYVGCVMYVYPRLAGAAAAEAAAIITHEAWHCYQGSTAGNATQHKARPPWVVEGSAEWVGEAFGGGPSNNKRVNENWNLWMSNPGQNLFGRTYDAVGFWATVAAATNDSDALGIMLRTTTASGGHENFYNAAVAGLATGAESRWASRYFRYSAAPAWDTVGTGVPSSSVAPAPKIANEVVGTDITASPRSAQLAYLDATQEVVVVTVEGIARVGDQGSVDTVVAGSFTGCTRTAGCKCPEGTHAPSTIVQVTKPVRIGVTGTAQKSVAHTKGMTLAEWCQKDATTTSSITGADRFSSCDLFTAEDAQLLTPDVSPTPAVVQMIEGNDSGTCLYGNPPSSPSSSSAFFLVRPTAELAAGDYPTMTGCTQELPGIGDRAGTGTFPEGLPMGCLLKGRTIVLIGTNGNAGAIPEVLRRIAARI